MQAEVLRDEDKSTGGDLFGGWTPEGNINIAFAIGPGRNAQRTTASFSQDLGYFRAVQDVLQNQGQFHVGSWRSIHKLGVRQPSAIDSNTCVSAMLKNNRKWFVLVIATIEWDGKVHLTPYRYEEGPNPTSYVVGSIVLCSDPDPAFKQMDVTLVQLVQDAPFVNRSEEESGPPNQFQDKKKMSLESSEPYSPSRRQADAEIEESLVPAPKRTEGPASPSLVQLAGGSSAPVRNGNGNFESSDGTSLSPAERYLHERRARRQVEVPYGDPRAEFVVSMRESDYDRIKAEVKRFPATETGGDLFGAWKVNGDVHLAHVIGPGKFAQRSSTTFNQDLGYLREAGRVIGAAGHAHIGDW